MAYTSSTLLADTSSTIREDLTNYITNLSPTDTPLFSLLGTESVSSITYDWLMDNVPYTAGVTASAEGADASFDMAPASNEANYRRQRARNTTMISTKFFDVSRTERRVNEAAVEDEYAYQVIRQGLSLMKQAEYNLHWSAYQDGASGNSYTRRTHGLGAWLLSTGIDESAVTIAGQSIANTYSSTVLYRAARVTVDIANTTDMFTKNSTITTQVPFIKYFDSTTNTMTLFPVGTTTTNPIRVRVSDVTTSTMPAGTYTTAFLASPYVGDDVTVDINTGGSYTAGTALAYFGTDLTRTELYDYLLAPAYAKGMNIPGAIALCGTRVKKIISNFATVYSGAGNSQSMTLLNDRTVSASAKVLYDTIDVYDSDLGPIYFHLDRYMQGSEHLVQNATSNSVFGWHDTSWTNNKNYFVQPSSSLFIIEPEYFKVAQLDGLTHQPLAKVGDSDKGMLVMEYGLKCLNPIAGIAGFGVVNG